MKTILVDAWKTFVTEAGIDKAMFEMLESYPNPKIILTNANDEELEKFGMIDLPYPIFTCKHDPDKKDPEYYRKMLEYFRLSSDGVVYFEHGLEAIESARSVGIEAFHYDENKKDLISLKEFLDESISDIRR